MPEENKLYGKSKMYKLENGDIIVRPVESFCKHDWDKPFIDGNYQKCKKCHVIERIWPV